MGNERSEAQLDLVRAVATAIDAGSEAEAALGPFFARQLPVDEQLDPFRRWVAELRRRTMAPPPADQLRRGCGHLDEFARSLAEVAARVDGPELVGVSARARRWSTELWDDRATAVSIYNEVRSALAELIRLRAELVLRFRD